MPGVKGFISFEGIEGSGKSTQAKLLAENMRAKGRAVLTTVEPGGTQIGQKIRALLLDPQNQISPLTEILLYNASRAQHVREVIYPALLKNTVVITDRFTDSTIAYQGFGRGLELSLIRSLDEIVVPDMKPFLTFLLDLDVEEGLRRNRGAQKEDRFELETVEFHARVRSGFIQLSQQEPDRIKVINASRSVEEVSRDIIRITEESWR